MFGRKKYDFSENLLHHIVSVTLVSISYFLNFHSLSSIMLITDCTDIFVALFKLTIDVRGDVLAGVGYFSMLFSWFYLRLLVFPMVLYNMWK